VLPLYESKNPRWANKKFQENPKSWPNIHTCRPNIVIAVQSNIEKLFFMSY